MSQFAPLPEPPYYAVIFSAKRTKGDFGYGAMADRMVEMASAQPGYIGIETTRDAEGFGITISYWADEGSLKGWKTVSEHMLAQKLGRERWYSYYTLRVAKVERQYNGPEGR